MKLFDQFRRNGGTPATAATTNPPPLTVNVAQEFTAFPGARYSKDGPYSGEEFRLKLLEPRFKEALAQNRKLLVNLDGADGYAASFLEEAFGGLARQYGTRTVLAQLELQCLDEPLLINEIEKYIREAVQP